MQGLVELPEHLVGIDEGFKLGALDAVLAARISVSTWIGRRDYALLLTMYNSGTRPSEMAGMQRGQVKFDSTTYLQLHGKGRKETVVPLWAKTVLKFRVAKVAKDTVLGVKK